MKNMEKSESPIQIQIETDPFVSLIEENLISLARLSKSQTSIYTVPERLRNSNEAAYLPKVVSIGPIHHETKKPALLKMESYKLFFFDQFLKRTSNLTLTDYANMMRGKEEKLRSCYSDSETLKGLNSEEFLKIILVDATFIIEFLLRSYSNSPYKRGTNSDYDYIFSSNSTWLLPDLQYDLLLFENQIPYFILEDLYGLIKYNLSPNNMQEVMPVKKLIHLFFIDIVWGIDETKWEGINDIQHLLDFVWKWYISTATPEQKQLFSEREKVGEIFLTIPSTTQLKDCGVSFRENTSKNLFDIKFEEKKGVLHIPRLRINDYTDLILRNLIAYEQCNCDQKMLTNYLSFIDNLVNTQQDVHLLVNTEIFENFLGDEKDVASLINKLNKGLVTNEDNYFARIGAKLAKYYRNSWHKWKANLKHNYFNNPWTIIAVVASAFLLILTVIQAVYSVYSAYNK